MRYYKQCPFCGKDAKNKYADLKFFYQCLFCGLIFKHADDEQDFNQLYKIAWSDVDNHKQETGGTDVKLARIYARKLAQSLGLENFSGLKILDFGAGDGSMLMALSELGADVYGLEPFGYEHIRNKGFMVFRSLDEIPEGILFDGVISIDVLEHVPFPWSTLDKLYGLLVNRGWLCVTTPNANSLNAIFLRYNWRELHNPSHLYFLTPRCLEVIFAKLGYTKFRRFSWFVQYSNNSMKMLVHYLLQLLKLDGEMRYIIYKN
jgi:2-polyprenyl-3-methyl-5-hydroxy-6-metoxy-1,4-benzoquinol methylase